VKTQDLPENPVDGGTNLSVTKDRDIVVDRIFVAGPNYDFDLDLTLGMYPLAGTGA